MTYTTRKASLKQIDMAAGNLDDALAHLIRVKNDYQDDHPTVAEAVEATMIVVVKAQQVINNLHQLF